MTKIDVNSMTLQEFKEHKSKMEKDAREKIQKATDFLTQVDLITYPYNKKKVEMRIRYYDEQDQFLFDRFLPTNMPAGFSGSKGLETLAKNSKREIITLPSGKTMVFDVVTLKARK